MGVDNSYGRLELGESFGLDKAKNGVPEYHPNNGASKKGDEVKETEAKEAEDLLNISMDNGVFDNGNSGIGELGSLGQPLNRDGDGVFYAGIGSWLRKAKDGFIKKAKVMREEDNGKKVKEKENKRDKEQQRKKQADESRNQQVREGRDRGSRGLPQ